MTKKPKKKPASNSFEVKLTRLASNNANLRTPTIKGVTADLPVVGKSFVLVGESLTPGGLFRLIETSVVTEVSMHGQGMGFKTMNSEYDLTLLSEPVTTYEKAE